MSPQAQAEPSSNEPEGARGSRKYNLFLLDEGPPKVWREGLLQKHGPYGLVVYS